MTKDLWLLPYSEEKISINFEVYSTKRAAAGSYAVLNLSETAKWDLQDVHNHSRILQLLQLTKSQRWLSFLEKNDGTVSHAFTHDAARTTLSRGKCRIIPSKRNTDREIPSEVANLAVSCWGSINPLF